MMPERAGHVWDGPPVTLTLRRGRPLGRLEAMRIITGKSVTLPWYSRWFRRVRFPLNGNPRSSPTVAHEGESKLKLTA